MSDYDFRPGGSLKLKGVAEGGVTKKKKKKDKSSKLRAETKEELRKLVDESVAEGPSHKADRNNSVDGEDNGKTEAERRFEEIQRRRMEARVKKLAKQTHKDRVHLFNEKLEALSEHHDIPKVGPG